MKKIFLHIFCYTMLGMTLLAQDFSGSMTSFGGGLYIPSAAEKSIGFNLFFNYGGAFNKNLALRGELVYHNIPFSTETSFNRMVLDYSGPYPILRDQSVNIKTDGSDYGITAKCDLLIGNFTDPIKLIYYGTFGIGFDISGGIGDVDVTYNPTLELSYGDEINNSYSSGPDYNFSFGLGGGVGYRISEIATIVCELRMEVIQDFQYFPIRIGFTFLPPISE